MIPEAAWRAIQEGVRRGDCVAKLELLGLPIRTIGMLEDSKYQIITLRDLVSLTQEDLLQIDNLGEKSCRQILECLSRYDQLDTLERGNGPRVSPSIE